MKINFEMRGFYPEHVYDDIYCRNGKMECENEIFYKILDKDGVDVYGNLPFGKAKRMTERLNKNGEYRPYKMEAVR